MWSDYDPRKATIVVDGWTRFSQNALLEILLPLASLCHLWACG